MGSKNILEIIITAKDEATKKLGGLNNVIGKLGLVAGIAGAAVVAAGVMVGKVIYDMVKEAAQVEKLSKTFDSLAKSIDENANVMIKDLRVASRGMLNDSDLMQASNKLVAMGLAKTSEESAKLVEMSTQLGSAMGMDATEAAEAFALMLANQSIPRLDNFGISSGKVRDRIEELMKANIGMTRETAFMTAVMEEGAKTMEKVGEQGTGAAANMAKLQANIDNLKVEIGKRFLPVLETITTKLLKMWADPQIQVGIDTLLKWIERIVGDEKSGLIGIVTYLMAGNVEKAFDIAFGEGAYRGLKKVLDTINDIIRYIKDIIYYLGSPLAVSVEAFSNYITSKLLIPNWASTFGTLSVGKPTTGGGWQHGGSFLVPGSGSGDRPYTMGLEPGEQIDITPRGSSGGRPVYLTINVNSAVSLSDMANAERVLLPIVERGLRTVMAR